MGNCANVRPGLSSFASGHNVTAFSQTYILAQEITAMSFTTSKAGITAKDLICEFPGVPT
jgi:hypothetical protein